MGNAGVPIIFLVFILIMYVVLPLAST